MSSAVVAPVTASTGRSVAYRSSSNISCGSSKTHRPARILQTATLSCNSASCRMLVIAPLSGIANPVGASLRRIAVRNSATPAPVTAETANNPETSPANRLGKSLLFPHQQWLPLRQLLPQRAVLRSLLRRQITNQQRQIRIRHRLMCALNPQPLH